MITGKYRFENGSLYEYIEDQNAYVHCYKNARKTTKRAAIKAYESDLLSMNCNDGDHYEY